MSPHEDPNAMDEDRLLTHEYDGIREYDNPLPGWWKWVFWGSIVYSFMYVGFYEASSGASIFKNFDRERAAFFKAQEAELANYPVSEESIALLAEDTDRMEAQKGRFASNCATCHGADAAGLSAPNLTDNYWLHGGTRMEIYETIRDGIRGKAMQPWLNKFGPVGVLQMAAYVDTLRGQDRPGPRGKEGKFVDPASLPAAMEPPTSE